jgi:23S rRNA (guanosine2251-2'-O)-methyltransferase
VSGGRRRPSRKASSGAPAARQGGRSSAGRAGSSAGRGGSTAGRAGAGPGVARSRAAGGRGPGTDASTAVARPRAIKGLGGEQVEGRQAVRELLLAGRRKVHELWVASDLEDAGVISDIVDLAAARRVPVLEVARRRLEAAARSEAPQGVLAKAAPLKEADLDDLVARRPSGAPPFLVAVDGVTDPGNLGALLRSAEGAGVRGVVLPRHRAVHITPTVAKAAAGAIEHLELAVVPGLPNALQQLSAARLWVVGLDDAAERSLFELGDLAAEPIALVLGAEGAGISRLVRERCDVVVSIPMRGRLSSLNVSAAAALACYEVARHRS